MIDFGNSLDFDDKFTGYISKCSKLFPSKKLPVGIPKIIMQTYKTHDIPQKWEISPESINYMMSDWKYVFMTDEDNRNFVEKHFPDFLPYYDAFPYGIQRADAIRAMWLYIHGGIYMDLDFEVQRDLSPLFVSTAEVFLVCSGNVGSYYTNSFMASRPKAKFWLEVIEEMKKPVPYYVLGKHFTVMMSTGPLMLSRVVRKTETVISVVPKKLVMPCSVCNLNCSTCESYLRPLEGSSWISWDTTFLNFWLCHWTKVVGFLVCLLVLIFIYWIVYKTGFSEFHPSEFFNFSFFKDNENYEN